MSNFLTFWFVLSISFIFSQKLRIGFFHSAKLTQFYIRKAREAAVFTIDVWEDYLKYDHPTRQINVHYTTRSEIIRNETCYWILTSSIKQYTNESDEEWSKRMQMKLTNITCLTFIFVDLQLLRDKYLPLPIFKFFFTRYESAVVKTVFKLNKYPTKLDNLYCIILKERGLKLEIFRQTLLERFITVLVLTVILANTTTGTWFFRFFRVSILALIRLPWNRCFICLNLSKYLCYSIRVELFTCYSQIQ